MTKLSIWLVFCSLLPLFLPAQQPHFREHTLPEYLGHSVVRNLCQPSGDLLWLGTDAGLVQFDGNRYQLYLRSDSLADERVSAIYQDGEGQLWIGYRDGGIFQYHFFDQLRAWEPEEGWPKVPITAFAEDAAGHLWIATYGEGLYYWNGRRLYNFGTEDGLSGTEVYTIVGDGRGRIWAATDGGISVCGMEGGQKQVQVIGREAGLPDEIVRVIEPDDRGNCWVGTYEKGFGYVSASAGKVLSWVPEWEQGVITALEMTSPEELWVGTEKAGVFRYKLQASHSIQLDGVDYPSDRINDLHRDAEGNIWVLKNNHELVSASLLFSFIRDQIGQVQAIQIDRNGKLWVGTQTGLFRRDTGKPGSGDFKLIRPGNFLSLFQDHYQNIWAGTFGEGVYIMKPDGTEMRVLSEKDGLTNGSILSIDGYDGKVWLATLGGATELSFARDPVLPGSISFQNYRQEDGLGTNFIYKVFVDSRMRVWFATDGEGLRLLEAGEFTGISEVDSAEIKTVYSITEDQEGGIWFSTPNGGIFRYYGEAFIRFGRSRGLPDRRIVSMTTDPKDQLLLVYSSGIDLFSPEKSRLVCYDKEVGIEAIQPNLNALFQDQDGNIWIGTQTGIIRYNGQLPVQQYAPEARMMQVSANLQPVDFTQKQEFSHSSNNLVFDYSGLWYSDPEAVRYRYKLEGYNPDWIISRDQQAVYSQLPPGEYIFRLSASENDLFFSESQVVYPFRVRPPFWSTPWFAVLLAGLFIGLIYLVVRNREQRVKREASVRRDKLVHQFELLKSQINPHFLFNNFNTLVTLIEENPPAAVTYVERLSDFYRSILQYRERPVISVRDELGLVRNYAALLQERFANNLRIDICDQLGAGYIIPLTLQLLVENAIKHNIVGRGNPLTISISEAKPGFIVVRNNLQPKRRVEPTTGFGLESIRKRYALLTNKPVVLEKNEKTFSVAVPLLELTESIN